MRGSTAAHTALDVVLGLPEGQPRLRQLIDVRRYLNMQLRVQAQVSQHRLRRHGPLQRLSGVSLPGVAQGKDSEAEIEYNTEPEPHRVFRTLHAADAPSHGARANTVDAHANHQQANRNDQELIRHVLAA